MKHFVEKGASSLVSNTAEWRKMFRWLQCPELTTEHQVQQYGHT